MGDLNSRAHRILVVDDDDFCRAAIGRMLDAEGYEVFPCADGQAALDLFAQSPLDIVLLDVCMAGMGGLEACERIRRLPGGERVPIVFLSGNGDHATHRRAVEVGADDFLWKPVQSTQLLARVRSLLERCRLQAELRVRNEEVSRQRDELRRVADDKRRLTAMIVHDLKAPLTGILANALFLERQVEGEASSALGDIVVSAETMHRMVLDMLDVSRSEDASLATALEAVDLGVLIAEALRTVRRRFDGEGRPVTVEIEPDLPTAELDPALVRRVVENLLDNAQKYTPDDASVHVQVCRGGPGQLEVRVVDRGPGVPAAFREAIFEPFAMLGINGARPPRTSRGLGLAFCKLAVQAHGGSIEVEEHPGGGARSW